MTIQGEVIMGDLSGQEGRKRRRELYRHHWLLGAFNDTLMPRREWLKLVGSSLHRQKRLPLAVWL
jgi:hypothetical protein